MNEQYLPITLMVNGIPTETTTEYHVVRNVMTNKEVLERKDTPWCCSVQSETFWSM
jgi:hypothetical protein